MMQHQDIGASSSPKRDEKREAQYGRLVMNVLHVLNNAVHLRQAEGETRAQLAQKIGCNRSQLSRTLNGSVRNLTLKTISDILWAARFEPEDFAADPYESISPNYDPGASISLPEHSATTNVAVSSVLLQSSQSGIANFTAAPSTGSSKDGTVSNFFIAGARRLASEDAA